jgi:hypothetical protein
VRRCRNLDHKGKDEKSREPGPVRPTRSDVNFRFEKIVLFDLCRAHVSSEAANRAMLSGWVPKRHKASSVAKREGAWLSGLRAVFARKSIRQSASAADRSRRLMGNTKKNAAC